MHFETYQLYHVYNRGNNRETVFFEPAHYLFFLKKLRQHILPKADILAYCLMPNHFYLLLRPTAAIEHTVNRALGTVLSSFTQGVNRDQNRVGSLFQAKTKAQLLSKTESYPRTCFHYIHQNPVRAGLAPTLEAWPYSSYRDYAGLRNGTLCNQDVARQLLDLPVTHKLFQQESEHMISPDYAVSWLP